MLGASGTRAPRPADHTPGCRRSRYQRVPVSLSSRPASAPYIRMKRPAGGHARGITMITVDGLVAVPSLGLAYLAGAGGGSRPVTWAHACDLPNPWRWVNAGDMVMTTGGGLPASAAAQARWIARLLDSRVSSLVIARKPGAPP